jgi:thiamine-phosphate pyrophosphorylase
MEIFMVLIMAITICKGKHHSRMLLCAITSRILLADTEPQRAERLIALSAEWAATGLDFIQIRERDLTNTELLQLSISIVQAVRRTGSPTRVLINTNPASACAIALQSGADGVHLPGGLDPAQLAAAVTKIRKDWKSHRKPGDDPAISVSCHTVADILAARAAGATVALFAPVFEKALPGAPALAGQGLKSLAEACTAARQPAPQPELPVLALGGVTFQNSAECADAGASGIAAIRLFLNSGEKQDWSRLLLPQRLRHVPVLPQS